MTNSKLGSSKHCNKERDLQFEVRPIVIQNETRETRERERDKRHTLITKYLFLFILQFYKQISTVQDNDVPGVCKSTQVGMYIYSGEPSTMR